jgi:2-oxoglutarate dehydrogenase complex dehydrogenase (E1) component-like enzyme
VCDILRVIQLILFFSKSLLRHPKAKSSLSEMVNNTYFQRFLPETSEDLVRPEDIRRHILCSGNVLAYPIRGTLSRWLSSRPSLLYVTSGT